MGTPRKINAILLNITINRPKLVTIYRYKLATYWHNFTQIYLTQVKILQKVLGWLLFLTHTVYLKGHRAVLIALSAYVWLQTKIPYECTARCKLSTQVLIRLSFSAVVFFESCIWQPRVSLSKSPTVSWLTSPKCSRNMNRLGWESLTRRRSAAWKLSTPLLVRCWLFATDVRENDYSQIPLLANSVPPYVLLKFGEFNPRIPKNCSGIRAPLKIGRRQCGKWTITQPWIVRFRSRSSLNTWQP